MPGYSYDLMAILQKIETTEGTDAAPVGTTDAIKTVDYTPIFMDAEGRVRNIDKAYFGADPVILSQFKRGATFSIEMAGAGSTATTVPPWMKVNRIAGFDAGVVTGGTSVVQTPVSTVPSATHWNYIGDETETPLLLKTVGARASMGFRIEDDDFPRFTYSVLGRAGHTGNVLAEANTHGTITLTGYPTPQVASTENTSFTLDGYALPLRSMEFNSNVDLQFRSLIGPADFMAYRNRSWSGSIVAEVPQLATKNYFGLIKPHTTMVLSLTHGVGTGNIVKVDAPAVQITGNVAFSEEQGKLMMTMPVTMLPVTGNDEVKFTSQ